MDMLSHLHTAIRYLEDHLTEEIDLTEVSRLACVSTDSFQRFFSYMTG